MTPQNNVERVKERLDIVAVVGGYVQLQKAGALLKARCPFHNEKSPSFTVSPVRQTYHCFGCGEHGDIFTFTEKIEGVDFRGALEILAQKAGVELVFDKASQGPSRDEKDELFAINEHATLHFETALKNEADIRAYLASRGLSDKTLETFRIGFARDAWQDTLDTLVAQGHREGDIEKVGLILTSAKEDSSGKVEARQSQKRYYDRFRSRIMFPICNAQGKVAGFTGRIWVDEKKLRTDEQKEKDAAAAKYVNSPETVLYHKSSILYGFYIAKHHIRPMNCAMVVEGQMDCLTCHQVGYTNTVAISGTALTTEQVQTLSRLSKNILLALDSDKAGVDATIKSIDKALSFGCDVKVVSFRGKDASEVLQNEGVEAVRACVRAAEDWCHYLLSVCEKRAAGDTRTRARLVNELVIPLIKAVENPLERDALLQTVHERTQLSLESLKESLAKAKRHVDAQGQAAQTSAAHVQAQAQAHTGALASRVQPQASNIKLLFACLDVPEAREHERYPVWQERIVSIPRPEIGDVEMHTLLATFPVFEHSLHVQEIVEELFARAEREHYTNELRDVGEALRSAELAGDDAAANLLARQAAELHKKLHTLASL